MELMRRRRGIMGLNGGAGIPVITATATGNPLSFVTDMVRPLKSLVIPFTPIQAAGTPSFDNPLPISGWTGCEITQTPEDLIELTSRSITNADVTINIGSSSISVTGMSQGNLIYKLCTGNTKTYPAGTYTIYCDNPDIYVNTSAFESEFRSNVSVKTAVEMFILDNVRMMIRKNIAYDGTPFHVYLFEGSNVIPTTLPINWQSEAGIIHGGRLAINENGTGLLRKSYTYRDMSKFSSIIAPSGSGKWAHRFNLKNWTTTWDKAPGTTNMVCDVCRTIADATSNYTVCGISSTSDMYVYDDTISTVAEFKAKYAGHYLAYELRSWGNYNLTEEQVGQLVTFLGTNTIWTDTNGTNTATYLKHQS